MMLVPPNFDIAIETITEVLKVGRMRSSVGDG